MKIEWPSKSEMKDVFIIILSIVCLIQVGVIVMGCSVVADLRDTAQEYRQQNNSCMMDYNQLWNDYSILQDEVFGDQDKYQPDCSKEGDC